MAIVNLNLPAPAGNGAGAAVDVSSLGAEKTIVVGDMPRATLNIEFSNEVAPTSWAPVATFQRSDKITVTFAARWMRARITGFLGGGAADVEVGADDSNPPQFATLISPAGEGAGASVAVSALGLFKTVQVGQPFRGTLLIEVSEDNVTWGQCEAFTAPGSQSGVVAARFMRVRRVGVPEIAPGLPLINIGAVTLGGGSSTTTDQVFTYTVTGLELDLSDFFVPLPAARLTDTYEVFGQLAGVADLMMFDLPDLVAGDRTTTQFRIIASSDFTAGDQISFLVKDPT